MVDLGLNETLSYILVGDKEAKQFTKDDSIETPKLLAPLTEERNTLRASILPSLYKIYEYNAARNVKDVSIFEIGKSFYKKGEEITIHQIAKELKIPKEDIVLAMESSNSIESIEASTYTNQKDGNSISLLETLASNQNEEEMITNKLTVNQLIENLETRDKEIILLRFYKEKTQAQVAKILGITQVQVSRLERKILGNMKNKLKEA